ncbi:uncharacterized protein BHQ10_002701 [Talaromyces amestolkiae]|uniref:Uncharacterized protein n=1 Tax=Talaromyces amestolkiae TaxID=1196081 RepID=A0A364KT28_TALAM|nr:uncharacterized protein BHQ10_002701 [Talaromyces amestolkiae]RAO66689.1 hypothetical protein BHQ10_002701 [Talaromyces amestolkiae]
MTEIPMSDAAAPAADVSSPPAPESSGLKKRRWRSPSQEPPRTGKKLKKNESESTAAPASAPDPAPTLAAAAAAAPAPAPAPAPSRLSGVHLRTKAELFELAAKREDEWKTRQIQLADDKHALEYYKKRVEETERAIAAAPAKIAELKKEMKRLKSAAFAAKK